MLAFTESYSAIFVRMKLRFYRPVLLIALGLVIGFFALSATPLQATFIQIPQPDNAYTSSTTLLPISGNDGDTLLALSDANLTVTFSALMQTFTSWATWGAPPATEGNTPVPPVLAPFDYLNTPSVTMTFSQGLTTFGLESEPDAFGSLPMRMDFFNGITLLGTVSYGAVEGDSGAVLFAASSMTPITSATLTIEPTMDLPTATDPGIARLRYVLAGGQSVPEGGSSIWLLAVAILAVFAVHRRSSKNEVRS
jgi:hypothetical protein